MSRENGRSSRSSEEILYTIGRECFGLSFCAYVLFLIEDCLRAGVDDIYFIAREGYLFQRIFNLLCRKVLRFRQFPPIRQHYIFLSRLSTSLPSVHEFGLREIIFGYWRPQREGLYSVLRSFDLDPEEFRAPAARHGITDIRQPIADPLKHEGLQGLIADPDFQALIAARRDEARSVLRAYLAHHRFFGRHQTKAFVDIGWNGTIQSNVARAFRDDEEFPILLGYYYGRHYFQYHDYYEAPRSFYMPGFAFDQNRPNGDEHAVGHLIPIFEMAAAGPSGTTIGYQLLEGRVMPRFRAKPASPWVKPLQRGILDYARWFAATYDRHEIDPALLNRTAARNLARFLLRPTREEAQAIRLLVHDLDWGSDDKIELVSDALRPWSILTPRRVHRIVEQSQWKEGTLRLSGMPFAFAYYRALREGHRLLSPILRKG
jgi:hypothetical protein